MCKLIIVVYRYLKVKKNSPIYQSHITTVNLFQKSISMVIFVFDFIKTNKSFRKIKQNNKTK